MKKLLGVYLFISLSFTSLATLAGTPTAVKVPIDYIYSPMGFDDNDNTEIIATGYLPNLCYKSPTTKVKVRGNKILIDITANYYNPGKEIACAEVIVPFMEVIKVGMLRAGLYNIIVNGKSIYQKKSRISIEQARTSAIDEFIYASVDYIKTFDGTKRVLLEGHNPSDCFVLDKIELTHNKKDTYSILPKMKQISDFCPMKRVPFSYEVTVPSILKSQNILLHVRSMDGNSVNTLQFQQ